MATYPLKLDTDQAIATKIANVKPYDAVEMAKQVENLQQAVKDAQEALDKYLTQMDYINTTTGSYESERYWRIHPDYYEQWTKGLTPVPPSWAVIRD